MSTEAGRRNIAHSAIFLESDWIRTKTKFPHRHSLWNSSAEASSNRLGEGKWHAQVYKGVESDGHIL